MEQEGRESVSGLDDRRDDFDSWRREREKGAGKRHGESPLSLPGSPPRDRAGHSVAVERPPPPLTGAVRGQTPRLLPSAGR